MYLLRFYFIFKTQEFIVTIFEIMFNFIDCTVLFVQYLMYILDFYIIDFINIFC